MGWGREDPGAHPHWGHHLFCIPVHQPGPVWERQVNLLVTHCLPGEGLRAASKVGPPVILINQSTFLPPHLLQLKAVSRTIRCYWLPLTPSPVAAVQAVGSDKGVGSDGIMQLSVIAPTVFILEIVLLWRLSFMWQFHIQGHWFGLYEFALFACQRFLAVFSYCRNNWKEINTA